MLGRFVCKVKGKHKMIDHDYCIDYDKRVISRECFFCDEYQLLEMMQKGDNGWYRVPDYTENDYEKLHYEEVKFD